MYRTTPRGQTYEIKHNISELLSLNKLINEYPNEKVIPQFIKLKQNYPYYRAVSGDGNCFYRAIAFLYLRQADLSSFDNLFQPVQNCCIDTPIFFQGISFEQYLHQIYIQYLKPLSNKSKVQRENILRECFNSTPFDPILIVYFRSLNYLHIKRNYQRYSNFIQSKQTVERIKKYGNDSQGIQYNSMAEVLNIKIVIKVTDENSLNTETYNDSIRLKSYQLFFRPGHFDILYHKDSEYIRQPTPMIKKKTFQQNPFQIITNNYKQRMNYDSRERQSMNNENSYLRKLRLNSFENLSENYQRSLKKQNSNQIQGRNVGIKQTKSIIQVVDNQGERPSRIISSQFDHLWREYKPYKNGQKKDDGIKGMKALRKQTFDFRLTPSSPKKQDMRIEKQVPLFNNLTPNRYPAPYQTQTLKPNTHIYTTDKTPQHQQATFKEQKYALFNDNLSLIVGENGHALYNKIKQYMVISLILVFAAILIFKINL